MPRDQLPVYNQHGQCISGSYTQATTAPRAPTPSTASYISTPGPVLHDFSHVYCEELSDNYCSNVLEINYNVYNQFTDGMNHEYARELPSHYLKHWGVLVDTGACVSVAPKHFAPEVPLEPLLHSVQLFTATSAPIKIYGTKTVVHSTTGFWLHHRRKADATGFARYSTRRCTTAPTGYLLFYNTWLVVVFWCAVVPVFFTKYLLRMKTLCCSNHGSVCCGSRSGCIPEL